MSYKQNQYQGHLPQAYKSQQKQISDLINQSIQLPVVRKLGGIKAFHRKRYSINNYNENKQQDKMRNQGNNNIKNINQIHQIQNFKKDNQKQLEQMQKMQKKDQQIQVKLTKRTQSDNYSQQIKNLLIRNKNSGRYSHSNSNRSTSFRQKLKTQPFEKLNKIDSNLKSMETDDDKSLSNFDSLIHSTKTPSSILIRQRKFNTLNANHHVQNPQQTIIQQEFVKSEGKQSLRDQQMIPIPKLNNLNLKNKYLGIKKNNNHYHFEGFKYCIVDNSPQNYHKPKHRKKSHSKKFDSIQEEQRGFPKVHQHQKSSVYFHSEAKLRTKKRKITQGQLYILKNYLQIHNQRPSIPQYYKRHRKSQKFKDFFSRPKCQIDLSHHFRQDSFHYPYQDSVDSHLHDNRKKNYTQMQNYVFKGQSRNLILDNNIHKNNKNYNLLDNNYPQTSLKKQKNNKVNQQFIFNNTKQQFEIDMQDQLQKQRKIVNAQTNRNPNTKDFYQQQFLQNEEKKYNQTTYLSKNQQNKNKSKQVKIIFQNDEFNEDGLKKSNKHSQKSFSFNQQNLSNEKQKKKLSKKNNLDLKLNFQNQSEDEISLKRNNKSLKKQQKSNKKRNSICKSGLNIKNKKLQKLKPVVNNKSIKNTNKVKLIHKQKIRETIQISDNQSQQQKDKEKKIEWVQINRTSEQQQEQTYLRALKKSQRNLKNAKNIEESKIKIKSSQQHQIFHEKDKEDLQFQQKQKRKLSTINQQNNEELLISKNNTSNLNKKNMNQNKNIKTHKTKEQVNNNNKNNKINENKSKSKNQSQFNVLERKNQKKDNNLSLKNLTDSKNKNIKQEGFKKKKTQLDENSHSLQQKKKTQQNTKKQKFIDKFPSYQKNQNLDKSNIHSHSAINSFKIINPLRLQTWFSKINNKHNLKELLELQCSSRITKIQTKSQAGQEKTPIVIPQLIKLPKSQQIKQFLKSYQPLRFSYNQIFNKQKQSQFTIQYQQNQYIYFGKVKKVENQKEIKEGQGVLIRQNSWIQATFQNDKPIEGVQITLAGKYQGKFKDYKRQGLGQFYWRNGQYYSGQWNKGLKHGSGLWTSKPNSLNKCDSYIGEWINGKVQGYGIHKTSFHQNYEGQFKNFLKTGKGRQTLPNGDTYQGQYLNGVPQGVGVYTWKNGYCYRGKWSQGYRHEQGILMAPSQKKKVNSMNSSKTNLKINTLYSKYSANNSPMKMNETKKNEKTEQIIYKGNFIRDKVSGYGQYIDQQKNIFIGMFFNGMKHGRGSYKITKQNKIIEGQWNMDKYIQKKPQQSTQQVKINKIQE